MEKISTPASLRPTEWQENKEPNASSRPTKWQEKNKNEVHK